jgi:hypothetical protein
VRRPVLAAIALSLLALLFGWETRQALQATPGKQDNSAMVPAGAWQPGVSAPDPQSPPDPTPAAAAVSARPLFRPDRQPFRGDGSGVSGRNYETELSRYTLIGVLGFGDAPVGVVVGKAGNKGERWELKAGDPLPGFTVKEVGMEGLRLTADGQEFLLPLYAGAPTAAGGALRTDVPRRDAASPKASSPTPPAVPSPPMVPARGTVARQPVPAAPAPPPVPVPGTSPAVAPRYIPGRR